MKLQAEEVESLTRYLEHFTLLIGDARTREVFRGTVKGILGDDLSGASVRDVNLFMADVRGANLSEVDLRAADLAGVILSAADLGKAVLLRTTRPAMAANLTTM